MILNAEEIQEMDEIHFDRQANESTLNIALNFYSNRTGELMKAYKKFWLKLYDKHSLDEKDKYKIAKVNGAMTIVKIEDDEKDS